MPNLTRKDQSRRSILNLGLRSTATAAIAGAMAPFAFAAGGSLDRAVVSLYLHGGWDSNNLLVPTESADYSAYARGRGPLAVAQSQLLPVPSSRQKGSFGLHPSFAELRDLYTDGALAIVANNGALPTPSFEHIKASYAEYAYSGATMVPWALKIQPADSKTGQPQIFTMRGMGILSPDRVPIQGGLHENLTVRRAMADVPRVRTRFPDDSFGSGLAEVAHVLASASRLGMRRMVVSIGLGGWDTHTNQAAQEPAQFANLSRAMAAFYQATQELGIADKVVTHTQTEFNRTLAPNAQGGTEHGWGGFSLVMGASVRGGDVFGHIPHIALGSPADFNGKGVWVPTTAHEQVAATIAYWFGVSMGQLATAIPGIQSYAEKTLGFLG
jgi:uncharacterized protein (DUF1501 family)